MSYTCPSSLYQQGQSLITKDNSEPPEPEMAPEEFTLPSSQLFALPQVAALKTQSPSPLSSHLPKNALLLAKDAIYKPPL